MTKLIDCIKGRRSVRAFTDKALPSDTVDRLVEAAVWAPSASNKQPWRFFVCDERAAIEAAAEIVKTAAGRVSKELSPEFKAAFDDYAVNFSAFSSAPLIIVPCYRVPKLLSNMLKDGASKELRGNIMEMERDGAVAGTAMAVQNMLLTAHDMGLGACCMTGPLLAKNELAAMLKIPDEWHMEAVIAVGYAAPGEEAKKGPGRKPTEQFIKRHREKI